MAITKTGLTDEQFAEVQKIEASSQAFQASQTPDATTPAPQIPTSPLPGATEAPAQNFDALFSKLLESDAVTSSTTGIEQRIASAIEGTEAARAATEERITSESDREKAFAVSQINAGRESQLDARRGFATNRQGLKLLEESNIKYINDLETRKQEALLNNDAAAASQIAGLQMDALAFEQQAKQQVYSNLLGLANVVQGQQAFQLQQQEATRMATQFSDNIQLQRDQMSEANRRTALELGAKYGVAIKEGETLEQLSARIAPVATKLMKAEMDALLKSEETSSNDLTMTEFLHDSIYGLHTDSAGNLIPAVSPEEAADFAVDRAKSLGLIKTGEESRVFRERFIKEATLMLQIKNFEEAEATRVSESNVAFTNEVFAGQVSAGPGAALSTPAIKDGTGPTSGAPTTSGTTPFNFSPLATEPEGGFFSNLSTLNQ